jgi:outer membrane protein
VAQAYLDVVRDQNLLAVNRNNEYVLGQEFESTHIRVEVGELTGTDLAQAQSSLEQATTQRVASEGQLALCWIRLVPRCGLELMQWNASG